MHSRMRWMKSQVLSARSQMLFQKVPRALMVQLRVHSFWLLIWRKSAAVWIRMKPLPRHYRKKQIFLQTFNLGDKGNSAIAGIPFFACLIL